jgi:hypothetical protein
MVGPPPTLEPPMRRCLAEHRENSGHSSAAEGRRATGRGVFGALGWGLSESRLLGAVDKISLYFGVVKACDGLDTSTL